MLKTQTPHHVMLMAHILAMTRVWGLDGNSEQAPRRKPQMWKSKPVRISNATGIPRKLTSSIRVGFLESPNFP